MAQGFGALLQFEVAEIFLNNVRHSRAQRGSEVLGCHLLLLFRVLKKFDQAICQILSIS